MNLTILSTMTLPNSIKDVQIIDLRKSLPVNPKYTWRDRKGTRSINSVKRIIMHHTGMKKDSTAQYGDVELASRIAKSHINSTRNIPDGDPGFPYTAYVRNGKLYICNDFDYLTFGAASNNTDSVHIAVEGDYASTDVLTDADRNALYAGYFLLKANLPAFESLVAHKEVNPTSCPGYDMHRVRNDLETIELTSAISGSPNDQMAQVYALKTRFDDLYNKAAKPNEWQEVAIKKLLKVSEFMKKENLL